VKGRGAVREWVKLRERNEALDLEVYALAGLYILGHAWIQSLGQLAERFARPLEGPSPPPDDPPQVRIPYQILRRARRGWVNRW
jgi:phage terminase large subunit GpA-like protein